MVETALLDLGIQTWNKEGVIRLPQHNLEFEFVVRPGPEAPNTVLLQVDFEARSPTLDGRAIRESLAGFGSTHEEALKDAFRKFLLGSFHVYLAALTGFAGKGTQAEWIAWDGAKTRWKICVAPVLVHGGEPENSTFAGFVDLLLELFASTADSGPHWVSVFVSALDGQAAGVDVRLDNESWPDGNKLAGKWDWHFPDGYFSLRHFFLALPATD